MRATIVKWGNSQGIRLPKALLDSANLTDSDAVELEAKDNSIIIKKADKPRRKTLAERLEGFEGEYVFEEWDAGPPVGREVW